MNSDRWFDNMTPFTSLIGLILIIFSLVNHSPILTASIVVVGLLNVIGYGFQMVYREPETRTLLPEICLFLWLFIVIMNAVTLYHQL